MQLEIPRQGGQPSAPLRGDEGSRPNRLAGPVFWTVLLLGFYREVVGTQTLAMVGSFNLTIVEPALFLCGLALARAVISPPKFYLGTFLTTSFGALIAIGVLRGLTVSPYDAITSLRTTGEIAIILVWGAFVLPSDLWHPRIQKIIVVVGMMLAGLVLLRQVMGPTFLISSGISDAEVNDGGRALSAQGTAMLGSAAIVVFAHSFRARSPIAGREACLAMALFMLVALALTKQATATLGSVVAFATLFAFAPGRHQFLRSAFVVVGTCAGVLFYTFLPDIMSVTDLNGFLPDGMAFDVAHRSATFDARTRIWTGLLTDMESWSPVSQAIGLPAGTKPKIWIDLWGGTYWKLSIHSMYYGVLPYAGILGLVIYVLIVIVAAVTCARRAYWEGNEAFPGAPIGFAFVVLLATLGVSYELRNENALLIVMAVAGGIPVARTDRLRRLGRLEQARRPLHSRPQGVLGHKQAP
ncbi:hypothetical protein [Bradyrhizobium sp. PRIMUS42]|uniref:hypothetical protein n=1 Tax=Bradyrhizobium sp. PRIMUS42 TaxID=2908926 RepID=UPI001FF2C373|nr:hypothetical protein [Bradyrhizobium sp. PRIMUS42]MCJ9729715.1 hypothetical protein [Bradyrhizobium sp. PRIMUS42]